jgi:hypothetical protein
MKLLHISVFTMGWRVGPATAAEDAESDGLVYLRNNLRPETGAGLQTKNAPFNLMLQDVGQHATSSKTGCRRVQLWSIWSERLW